MPRGGLSKLLINFKKVENMTMKEVFGAKPIPATQIMKKIWNLIKEQGLRD